MKGLTESQKKVLRYIRNFLAENGYAPTAQEIASEFKWGSKTAALDHLRALEKKKFLSRKNGKARSIQLLLKDSTPNPAISRAQPSRIQVSKRPLISVTSAATQISNIPVFGSIPAGPPQTKSQDSQGCLSVNLECIGVKPTPRTFALEVKGDSMVGRHILEGDVVVLEHGMNPKNGDVVAALIDGESTLKTYVEINRKPFLKAENPAYPDLLPAEELVTQGVMIALIRKNP